LSRTRADGKADAGYFAVRSTPARFLAARPLNNVSDLKRLFIEKLPLIALSIASSVVTILAQRASGAIESFEDLPFLSRVSNAVVAYVKYIAMMFFPSGLGVLYPYRAVGIGAAIASLVILVVISALCIWNGRSRRYLLFGWLWFLGTLVPVIGLVQVGGQSMADRYTYVPYFGLFVMVVWGGAELLERIGLNRRVQIGFVAVVIVVLSAVAYTQTRYWRDSETLYTHTLSVTGDNYLISHNLCYVYVFADRLVEARPLCERAIDLNANYVDGYNTLGILELKEQNLAKSEQTFRDTIKRWPGYAPAYGNLATVLIIEQKPEDAEKVLEAGTRVGEGVMERTQWVGHARDLAVLYAAQNKYDKAVENYSRAIFLAPNRADLRYGAASVLYRSGNFDPALQQLQAAISLDPNNAESFNLAGMIFAAKGNASDAKAMFEKALVIKPGFEEAKANLSKLKGSEK
jgi:tetratricopeptide (TPR) repeat protein